MARPRLPDAHHAAAGSALKDPKRFKDRTSPKVRPLGPAPKKMTDDERQAWADLASEIPWLGSPDRRLVAMAARLSVRFDEGELSIGGMTELRQILVQLGASPSARSKVTAPPEDEDDDPAAEFIQ